MQYREYYDDSWQHFSWWFIGAIVLSFAVVYLIIAEPEIYTAFKYIRTGVPVTLLTTAAASLLALVIGLPVGLCCNSRNPLLRNIALLYMALVGGIPTLVMLFLVAFVIFPFADRLIGFQQGELPLIVRGSFALALAYSVILADIIRLSPVFASVGRVASAANTGIQEPRRLLRAASHPARRNTVLAVGITFIALLKDSSLVSVLAVLDITQRFKIYMGSTLRLQEAIFGAIFLYLVMTVPLRYLLWRYEHRSGLSDTRLPQPGLEKDLPDD